jgi:hypothetical protein
MDEHGSGGAERIMENWGGNSEKGDAARLSNRGDWVYR